MARDYELLERKVLTSEECKVHFTDGDKFTLLRAYDGEKGLYTVDIAMPWPFSSIYRIDGYADCVQAQMAFHDTVNKLTSRRYGVRILGPVSAEIVELPQEDSGQSINTIIEKVKAR